MPYIPSYCIFKYKYLFILTYLKESHIVDQNNQMSKYNRD